MDGRTDGLMDGRKGKKRRIHACIPTYMAGCMNGSMCPWMSMCIYEWMDVYFIVVFVFALYIITRCSTKLYAILTF